MDIFRVMCLVCIVLLMIYPVKIISVSDTDALLKLKQSFTNAASLESWKPGTDPCDKNIRWLGVFCQKKIVTGLLLAETNLSGIIDVEALSQMPGLRTLSFQSNLFSGPMPEFNRMGALKGLYLSENQFSGEIPSNYFAKMLSLKKLWLSDNKFSGEIPASLMELQYLIELHLENNQFTGPIPPMSKQSTLESIDFSNNNLKGEIPVSLSRFNESSFKGNSELCGEKLGKPCDQATNSDNTNNNGTQQSPDSNSNKSISMWIVISLVVLLLIVIIVIYLICRYQQSRRASIESFDEPSLGRRISSDSKKSFELSRRGSSIRKGSIMGKRVGDLTMVNDDKGEFGLADLMKAAAEVLGNGPLGSSYKAMMSNGLTVVVKRIKEMNKIGKEGFDAEVKRLGSLRHKNILTLLAYHHRKEEKLFVYEYIPKGSLLYVLHGKVPTSNFIKSC